MDSNPRIVHEWEFVICIWVVSKHKTLVRCYDVVHVEEGITFEIGKEISIWSFPVKQIYILEDFTILTDYRRVCAFEHVVKCTHASNHDSPHTLLEGGIYLDSALRGISPFDRDIRPDNPDNL